MGWSGEEGDAIKKLVEVGWLDRNEARDAMRWALENARDEALVHGALGWAQGQDTIPGHVAYCPPRTSVKSKFGFMLDADNGTLEFEAASS